MPSLITPLSSIRISPSLADCESPIIGRWLRWFNYSHRSGGFITSSVVIGSWMWVFWLQYIAPPVADAVATTTDTYAHSCMGFCFMVDSDYFRLLSARYFRSKFTFYQYTPIHLLEILGMWVWRFYVIVEFQVSLFILLFWTLQLGLCRRESAGGPGRAVWGW